MLFIDRCHDCPYQGKAIGPRGNPASPIILVGEAPGAMEIVEGLPFVGRAGGVLSEALAKAHLDEAGAFITKRALAERVVGTGETWLTELSTAELRDLVSLSADAVAEE
jgi:uracil-DNA glycosylase